MTARVPENVSTWLVDWSIVTVMGNMMPPRDPNETAGPDHVRHSVREGEHDRSGPFDPGGGPCGRPAAR